MTTSIAIAAPMISPTGPKNNVSNSGIVTTRVSRHPSACIFSPVFFGSAMSDHRLSILFGDSSIVYACPFDKRFALFELFRTILQILSSEEESEDLLFLLSQSRLRLDRRLFENPDFSIREDLRFFLR